MVHDLAQVSPGIGGQVLGHAPRHPLQVVEIEPPLLGPVVAEEGGEGGRLLRARGDRLLQPEEGVGRGEGEVEIGEGHLGVDPLHGSQDRVEDRVGRPPPEFRVAVGAGPPERHHPAQDLLEVPAEQWVPGVGARRVRRPQEPEIPQPVHLPAEIEDRLEGRAVDLGVDHQDAAAPGDLLRQEAQQELRLAGAGAPEDEGVPQLGLGAQADPAPGRVPADGEAVRDGTGRRGA